MGRITLNVTLTNPIDQHVFSFCGLMDTGAAELTLPGAWKDRLGTLKTVSTPKVALADQSIRNGEICGPVLIALDGFEPFWGQVLFIPMEEPFEPLIGYTTLEHSQAGFDMVNHRLIHCSAIDCKGLKP